PRHPLLIDPEGTEPARVQLVGRSGQHGREEEGEEGRGRGEHHHRARGRQCGGAESEDGDADRHGDDDGGEQREQSALRAFAAQGACEQGEPQAENVCNHSRPSTSAPAPESSTNRAASVWPARTSSIVPSASTSPSTITATREQTRSTRSMPWLDRMTVPPCAT